MRASFVFSEVVNGLRRNVTMTIAMILTTAISVGLLGNPFFVATIAGITDAAKAINPDVQVTSVSADYDLNKQVSQIDSFVAAGTQIIMLNAVDAAAIEPAVTRAKNAGAVVAAPRGERSASGCVNHLFPFFVVEKRRLCERGGKRLRICAQRREPDAAVFGDVFH